MNHIMCCGHLEGKIDEEVQTKKLCFVSHICFPTKKLGPCLVEDMEYCPYVNHYKKYRGFYEKGNN